MSAPAYPESWRIHDERSRGYIWIHRGLGWGQLAVNILWTCYWFFSRLSERLNSDVDAPRYIDWLVYFGLFAIGLAVTSLAFGAAGQLVERKFSLSKQSWPDWLWDQLKALVITVILGSIVLALTYSTVILAGDQWWLWAALMFVLLSVVLAQLAPVLLLPLLIELEPLPSGDVRDRILALCKKHSVAVREIYRLGLGAKTEKGNAAFMGLGRTKRIAIGDTILDKFQTAEIEAVFAHELGHQVNSDVWRGLILSAVLLLPVFYLVSRWHLIACFLTASMPHSAAGILVFAIMVAVVQIPLGWVQNIYLRSREQAADNFAKEQSGLAEPLASALERLTFQNRGVFKPNPVLEFFTYSHPSPYRRINYLRGA